MTAGKSGEDGVLPVIQADRQLGYALHKWRDSHGNALDGFWEGRYDESESMQSIARHRIEAQSHTTGALEVGRLRAIVQRVADGERSEAGHLALLNDARAALANNPYPPAIPDGMVAWMGGEGPAADWNEGSVLLHNGRLEDYWPQHHPDEPGWDVFAYTPKSTPPADALMGEVERRGMDSAPKDGRMLRLLIDYTDGGAPLEDALQAWTIGFNNFGNDDEDRWQFAGWCWSHDHFTDGSGEPVGWLPWSNPPTGGDDA